MIQVKGHEELARDPNSGAVIMTDTERYQEYMRTYNELKSRKLAETNDIEARFAKIEDTQTQMLSMLERMMNKLEI